MNPQPSIIAIEWAKDWFTIAPKYRTKTRLAEQIQRAINETERVRKTEGAA